MNCYFSVKIFAFLGKSDGAADGSIKIFVNRVFDGFFNMFAKSVADVDLFACQCNFHNSSLQKID